MIGSLRGVVLERLARSGSAAEVLLEVGGVGYRVTVPAGTLAQVSPPGGPAFLHVHTHVREDAIVLYGFATRDQRACFEALIGAHGVGPAVAVALLSVHSPAALQRAVHAEDADALMLVPGIGRKTATRLLVELKARLDFDALSLGLDGADLHLVGANGDGPIAAGSADVGADGDGSDGQEGPNGSESSQAEIRAELRTALSGLGYGNDEIRHALSRLPSGGGLEQQLRSALRELAGVR
jgi:Holliday junction DNA helicase RuvA